MKPAKYTLIILMFCLPSLLIAEDSGMRFTIGPFYRDFDDVDVNRIPVNFRNSDNATTPGGPFGVQGYRTVDPLITEIPADYVNYTGNGKEDVDSSDNWGPMIGVEIDMIEETNSILKFVSNIQFFNVQTDVRDSTNFGGFNVLHDVILGTVIAEPDTTTIDFDSGLRDNTNPFVEQEFDMDLFVLDLGLKSSYTVWDPFIVSLAAGPSMNIAFIDTSRRVGATWVNPTGVDTRESYSTRKDEDDDDEYIWGAYIAAEGEVRVTDSTNVLLGIRYDWAYEEAGTSQGEIDLETTGGYIKLSVGF